MATVESRPLPIAMTSSVPSLDAHRERMDFDNALRLWSLGVRFATRDLVALGRPFELHLTPHVGARPLDDITSLGFDLTPLYGSYVMRVATTSDVPPRMASRIVSLHGAPTAAYISPLDVVRPDDFLVGIEGDDLLLAPSSGLTQVRKRVLAACNAAIARGGGDVVLRFVRLDRTISVDPIRNVTHGSVLLALNKLEKHHKDLKTSYDDLLNCNRIAVTQRLTRHKKLLGFGVHIVESLKETVMQDDKFKFAAKFQEWYIAMMTEREYLYSDGDDNDDEAVDDVEMVYDVDANGEAEVVTVPPIAVDMSRPPAQPRPMDLDLSWRDILHTSEMKWLSNSHQVLTKFIEGLVDGFASDGRWVPEIATSSRSIVETLVTMYTTRLRTSMMDNTSVRKEFMQHARMLRSNIANTGNQQLRSDILSGAISIATLCEMSSEQLAPKALQADRQRRSEQHAKEITLLAPSGPELAKTRHGFKEVTLPGTFAVDTSIAEVANAPKPPEEVRSIPPPVSSSASQTTVPFAPEPSTDDVTQRLSGLDVRSSKTGDKKRVDAGTISTIHRQETIKSSQPTARAPTFDNAVVTPDDCRAFLKVLFDPAQDLEGAIGQLQAAVHSTPLSTMSNEFMLASGVRLYRDILTSQTQRGGVYYRARVRLLIWTFEKDLPNDREATMNALGQLLKELQECRRLFGTLLDKLRLECGFPRPATNHHAHRHAIDVLVQEGMKVRDQPSYQRSQHEQCRADAWIDGIDIVTVYAESIIHARDLAARNAASFMSDLVALRLSIPQPPVPPQPEVSSFELDHYEHNRYQQDSIYPGSGVEHHEGRFGPAESSYNSQQDRKRPFDHIDGKTDIVEPPLVRQKVDLPRGSPEMSARAEVPPLFFEDPKGEARRSPVDPAEKERNEKMQVETYQELIRALFRDPDAVKARAHFTWNANVAEEEVEFTSRVKVIRTISRSLASGDVVCSLQGLDGNLFITDTKASLTEASESVTQKLHGWLDSIYSDWKLLLETYNKIVERKLLQRGKQADDRLSAANETRKDRAVNRFTADQEKTRGSLSEYTITIRTLVAVRQVCLNMKMAKRAAGEEFRDLLDWMNRTRLDALRGTARPTPASSAPQNQVPPKPPARPSNMIICSDGSDDDDYDDYYGGGGHSDDDDWLPQSKDVGTQPAGAQNGHGGMNLRFRIDETLKQPYPIESERGHSDDARFRAVIRSLFTPEDDLCRGISGIRGALKYRGQFDTHIVPNVKANIRLELLRGEFFNVYASVNDVIHCKATAKSKPDACNVAVDGLLKELDQIRQIWTEMIHFYHTKELSNNDPMDTFNALRLANIAKIETRVESPPTVHPHNRLHKAKMASDIHCAIYFGDKVVYRVNEAVENDAHTMATCYALRFVVDLIDKGLDPRPLDEQDQRFAPLPDADWRCRIDLHMFEDPKIFVEFHADARWAIPQRVPGRDFGLPNQLTLRQLGRISMPNFERDFRSSNDHGLFFFRLEATYENGKFLNHIAEYGHKNKYRAYVLHLEVLENTDLDVFLFPPGASVNSTSNLYWSRNIMPREIDDIKSVYGYVVRRRRPTPRW